jgi:glyoxylase-like metal-dependent hydrolase (beta-lactamase superfamily II)
MNAESLLQYPQPGLPAAGTADEVAPGVHWVRMPLPYALDHINLWLLEDGGDWVVVDTGLGNEATRELWQKVLSERVGTRQVSRVIVTHYHPDHAGNAGWMTQKCSAPLWMSQAEFLTAHAAREGAAGFGRENVAAMYARNGLDDAIAAKMLGGGNHYRRGVPEFPSSYCRLSEGDLLSIGGRQWRVIMGYGHAPEHAALYCDALGVLISGDMVLPRISTNVSVPSSQPQANPLKLFLDSIARYATLPADTLVLPSHGQPFRGLRERAAQLQEHHRLRLAELVEACAAPKSAAEVLSTLFRRNLDGHQIFFAMGEAMAHLHFLYEQGLLSRAESGGVVRYIRA